MTTPIDLPPITLAEALRIVQAAIRRPQTHYDGCWRVHLPCAIAAIERLTRLLEAKALQQTSTSTACLWTFCYNFVIQNY